jgi:transcriptional regulator with PAS, ATPase and Fis domain
VDERNQIITLMKKYKNNKSHVAKELGITRQVFTEDECYEL